MPRRALSDEPQTDNESEQEEQEQPAGGLKNPGRTLQHMMLQVFFSRPVMTNAAVKRVYAKCVKLSTSEHICCLPTGAWGELLTRRLLQSPTRPRSLPSCRTSKGRSPRADSRSRTGLTSTPTRSPGS